MKRILITGATGFIGRHCLEALLESDFEIHATSSQPRSSSSKKVKWYRADLHDHLIVKDLLATIRPAYLLHSAWHIELGSHWASEENFKWVTSTINLAQAFINNGGQRLTCIGTCAEYDWSQLSCSRSLSEDVTLLNPRTVYGASKAGLFMMLENLCKAKGIGFVWARPFGPYGLYDNPKRLIPNTVLTLLRGDVMICNNPHFVRNFTFVEDIARIMVELMDSTIFGAINIANTELVKLGSLVELIARLIGVEKLIAYGQPSANAEPIELIADISKLKNKIGYVPKTSLAEGLEKSIVWWKQTEFAQL